MYDSEYEALHGSEFLLLESEVILGFLSMGSSDALLDLGSGTGRLAELCAPICRSVYAVDRSPSSIAILKARMERQGLRNVMPVVHDVTSPLTLGVPMSRVLCSQVLQHVPGVEARRQVVRNAAASLADGGHAVFIDEVHGVARRVRSKPREASSEHELYFHPFEAREYATLLHEGGFARTRLFGLGFLYWTRYQYVPRLLTKADALLSRVRGISPLAKFLVAVASVNEGHGA